MIVLKWLLLVVLLVYGGSLAVLFFKQREMLFPIPPVGRTAPSAAGFPEAEEHVLTTADGEKVIIWAMPGRAGIRASADCCRMRRQPTPSHPPAMTPAGSWSGAFRSAPASRSPWRRNI